MSDLPLTKLAETDRTITLGWTPPAGQEGYLPTIDGSSTLTDGKRHPGTSPTANSVKIGKPQDGQPHVYGVQILGSIAAGTWPPPAPPPTTGEIPNYALTLQPGWKQSEDADASKYNGLWVYPQSPTTPWRAPNGRDPNRHLLLDPRLRDANGVAGQDEWWFIIERLWPAAFNPRLQYTPGLAGVWGRETNFHNVPGDAGNVENGSKGGIGWQAGFGSGSSSLALDWEPGADAPSLDIYSTHQSEGGFDFTLPAPPRDEWQTYLLHWVAGRIDGTTVRPGLAQVWVNGTKVLDRANLNTIQRAQGPVDGRWYVQRWMTPWEGCYCHAITGAIPVTFALTRMGRTFAEAVADRPRRLSDSSNRQVRYEGTAPAPTLVPLPLRAASAARLPALP